MPLFLLVLLGIEGSGRPGTATSRLCRLWLSVLVWVDRVVIWVPSLVISVCSWVNLVLLLCVPVVLILPSVWPRLVRVALVLVTWVCCLVLRVRIVGDTGVSLCCVRVVLKLLGLLWTTWTLRTVWASL